MKRTMFRGLFGTLLCVLLALPFGCAKPPASGAVLLTPVPTATPGVPTSVPTQAPTATPEPEPQLRYIFLFIGDGMGQAQVAAVNAALSASGASPLRFTEFPVHGTAHTNNASGKVTDSAAAATALATGVKTDNGMLGLAPDGTRLVSLTEELHETGRAIGLVVTGALDDATPAGFYAHRDSRKDYAAITEELIGCGYEFLSGGGLYSGMDLRAYAAANGFTLAADPADASLPAGERLVLLPDPAHASGVLPFALDGGARAGLLSRTLKRCIDRLLPSGSFFIMAEGSRIDHACHYHDAGSLYGETLDFDLAVREAVAFYEAHPQETLIVVTADHETGGLSQSGGDPAALTRQTVSAETFSADAVSRWKTEKPAFPEILPALEAAFGLTELSGEERAYLETAYAHTLRDDLSRTKLQKLYGQKIYPAITLAAANLVAARAGLAFSTTAHTGADVSVYALGLGAERFSGAYENTAIHDLILLLIGAYPI